MLGSLGKTIWSINGRNDQCFGASIYGCCNKTSAEPLTFRSCIFPTLDYFVGCFGKVHEVDNDTFILLDFLKIDDKFSVVVKLPS